MSIKMLTESKLILYDMNTCAVGNGTSWDFALLGCTVPRKYIGPALLVTPKRI